MTGSDYTKLLSMAASVPIFIKPSRKENIFQIYTDTYSSFTSNAKSKYNVPDFCHFEDFIFKLFLERGNIGNEDNP